MSAPKTLLAILAALSLSISAYAVDDEHEYEEYDSNEIGLSYGRASVPGLATTLGAIFGAAFSFGQAKVQMDVLGAGTLSYYHWFNDMFAVGCDSSLELTRLTLSSKKTDADGNTYYDDKPGGFNVYATLMPAIKGRWVNKPHFGFYSKLAVGGMMQHCPATDSTDSDGNAVHTDATTNFNVGWQVTPVGLEFGGRHLRGFTELGFGMEGLILAGIRYGF